MMIANFEETLRRFLIPVGAALLGLAVLSKGPAYAEPRTYVIEPHEGYGVSGCFVDGVDCSRVVAAAFCESQGRGKPLAFGLASDVTASIASKPASAPAAGALLITCAD
jgi:hypothetical protein